MKDEKELIEPCDTQDLEGIVDDVAILSFGFGCGGVCGDTWGFSCGTYC